MVTGTYPVTVTITNTANGAVAIASSQAGHHADADRRTRRRRSPRTERTIFSGPVAEFTDPNPTGTASEFSALINWGDGSPESAATITLVSSTATSTTFLITGTHDYADLYGTPTATSAAQTSSSFPLSIHVVGTDGSSINLADAATVTGGPFTVTGSLNPASDSGISDSDDITNVVQPTFLGTAGEPFARIDVYAGPVGTFNPSVDTLLGSTTAGSTGSWSLTSGIALADGGYTITAVAVDATNSTITNTATVVPDLVIDTVGPKVTSLSFDRFQGRIVVTFQDLGGVNNAGSGMDLASVIDATNYQLVTAHHPRVGKYVVNVHLRRAGDDRRDPDRHPVDQRGQVHQGGLVRLHDLRGQPVDAQRRPGHRRQRAGRRVLRLLPLGEQHPRRQLRRPAHGDPPHHLRALDDHRPGDAGHPPGTRQGSIHVSGTVNPSKLPRSSSFASARSRASQKAADKVDHHSHPTIASSTRSKAPGRTPRRSCITRTRPCRTRSIRSAARRPRPPHRPRQAVRPRPWVPSAPSTRRWTSSVGPSTPGREVTGSRIPATPRPRGSLGEPESSDPAVISGQDRPGALGSWGGPLSAVRSESRPGARP